MKNLIHAKLAGNMLLSIFSLLLIFHLLVIIGIIPSDIVWAGRFKDSAELVRMETISIFIVIVASVLVALKLRYITWLENRTLINVGIWLLFILFVLNTLGNLTAVSPIEKYGFGTLTLLSALLTLRLVVEK